MCPARVGAHHGAMFNSYEMTRALVAERQGTLRHEARQNRLARGSRRGRRASGVVKTLRTATPVDPAPPLAGTERERVAA